MYHIIKDVLQRYRKITAFLTSLTFKNMKGQHSLTWPIDMS